MKKLIFITLAISLFSETTIASHTLNVKKITFSPQTWWSQNSNDVVTIESGSGNFASYQVQIVVNYPEPGKVATGINIKGCGNVTHVKSGSAVVCTLNSYSPLISFASENNTITQGSYSIK